MWNKEINGLETLADVVNPIIDHKVVKITYWDANPDINRTVIGRFWESPSSWDEWFYLFMESTPDGQISHEISPYYMLKIEEYKE